MVVVRLIELELLVDRLKLDFDQDLVHFVVLVVVEVFPWQLRSVLTVVVYSMVETALF